MASMRGTAPRVSIIVRTIGRPELPRALASIAAQDHRPLEIVLVDAAGLGHLPPAPTGIPMRVTGGTRLDRPRAANAGLEAASADWLLFLDEDDEIAPGHVASLLAVATIAGRPVAYSQARMVDAAGRGTRLLGGPFDRAALHRSNYLVMHAVLFHRSLLASGCRFDESMPILEDWDFWLQLASRTDFAFTGQPTALYHASGGDSGAGAAGNQDREALLAQRARIVAKWGTA
jgi:glycosyltransferase involved in cell wall biosynthesis